MRPRTKVTFFHNTLFPAGEIVRTPDGWKKATISLERHPEFCSLIKYFKGNFQWYGKAMQLIKQVEDNDGPNGLLRVLIEVAYATGVWQTLFDGQLKLAQLEEIIIGEKLNYKMLVPMIRDDFWSKFINRYEASVNLQSTTDLDGGTRTAVNKITLPMPSQVIRNRSVFEGSDGINGFDTGVVNVQRTAQIGLPRNIGEIKETYEIPFTERPNNLSGLVNVIQVMEQGDIVFNVTGTARIQANSTQNFDFSSAQISFLRVGQTGQTETIFQTSLESTNNVDRTYDLSGQRTLNAVIGDWIYIYVVWNISHEDVGPTTGDIIFTFDVDLSIEAVQNSTMPDTETDAYLIKDAAESIISKLVGQNAAVKSDHLSNSTYNQNAIFRGKHVRGYPFSEKEFAMSMKEWWNGANGLLNLSLGYTEVAGVKKIEIEEKAFHFNPTPVVNIGNVKNIVRRYDLEKFYKVVELSFKKSLSESESGIDDPQTNRTLNTDFTSFGKEEKIVVEFLAASLAIERSRRNRVELGKDDRNDEEIMVVAVKPDGEGGWTPEFGDSFAVITNLLNADFRINVRHSAMRIFKRWQNWLSGCMTFSTTGLFRFGKGEGNYEMTSQLDPADYEAESNPDIVLAENENVAYDSSKRLFVPKIYEIKEVPLTLETFNQIDANKNRAVGFSRSTENYVPMFLMDFSFEIFGGSCNGLIMQATDQEL